MRKKKSTVMAGRSETISSSRSPGRSRSPKLQNFGDAPAKAAAVPLAPVQVVIGPRVVGPAASAVATTAPPGSIFPGPALGRSGLPPLAAFAALEEKIQTTQMDFSKLVSNSPVVTVDVPESLVQPLMTVGNKQTLLEESGCSVEWKARDAKVLLTGSAEQVKACQKLLQRVKMHCQWGVSEEKVIRLLRPQPANSILCKLSPMDTLPAAQKVLAGAIHSPGTQLSVGKGPGTDVTIDDPLVSRVHAVLELDPDRGCIYVFDCSTNGTFLNGHRLPPKKSGKVLLSHGDELLLKDPRAGGQEFGYIVNIEVLNLKEQVKLVAPRRKLSPEETSMHLNSVH